MRSAPESGPAASLDVQTFAQTARRNAATRSTDSPPLQVLAPLVQTLDPFLFPRLGIDAVEAFAPCLVENHQMSRIRRGDPLHLILCALGAIELDALRAAFAEDSRHSPGGVALSCTPSAVRSWSADLTSA